MLDKHVFSKNGYPIGFKIPDRSYWAIKFKSGLWVCEQDPVTGRSGLDWTLDIITTGDWKNIDELWLLTPSTPLNPLGNTARLKIEEPGTAFQIKVGTVDSNIVASIRTPVAQIIGKVTNKESGACECFVFDYQLGALILWKNENVYNLGKWKPDIVGTPQVAPIGRLNFDVVGIHL